MAEPHSKPRQQAEIAFGKAQSQLLAHRRAIEERNSVELARAEKTSRLREARLARESTAAAAPTSKGPRQA